ncbi:MAG: hypothetical protein WCW40_06315 [Bacteroidota bacterium]
MKKIIFVITVILTVISLSPAQTSIQLRNIEEHRLEHARKNFAMGLRSGNEGVIESTMTLVAKMKLVEPAVDIHNLGFLIDSLASANVAPSLRYKAYLISNICATPTRFSSNELLNAPEAGVFFSIAAQQLQHVLLGISSL